jgi:hypothetical protein
MSKTFQLVSAGSISTLLSIGEKFVETLRAFPKSQKLLFLLIFDTLAGDDKMWQIYSSLKETPIFFVKRVIGKHGEEVLRTQFNGQTSEIISLNSLDEERSLLALPKEADELLIEGLCCKNERGMVSLGLF